MEFIGKGCMILTLGLTALFILAVLGFIFQESGGGGLAIGILVLLAIILVLALLSGAANRDYW